MHAPATTPAPKGRSRKKPASPTEESLAPPPAPTVQDAFPDDPGEEDLDALLLTEEEPGPPPDELDRALDEEPAEDHWRAGRDAFATGAGSDENPHPDKSDAAARWTAGWEAARPRETDDAPPAPPTEDSAREDGRRAHTAGATRLESPYIAAALRDAWEEGWDEASRALPPEPDGSQVSGVDAHAAAALGGAATAASEAIRAWVQDAEAVADTLEEVTAEELRSMEPEQVDLLLLGIRAALRSARQRERAARVALEEAGPGLPPPEGMVRHLFPHCRTKALEVEMVRVQLNVIERLERADELARSQEALDAHEAHAGEVKSELNARQRLLENDVARLTRIVRDSAEERKVPVVHLVDFDQGLYRVVRQDTGEILRTRPLSGEERQGSLFGAEGAE